MASAGDEPIDPFSPIDPYGEPGRPETLTSRLLVAAPRLTDPNFRRRVVLVLDHGPRGALGLVINRPGGVRVEEFLYQWEPVVSPPTEVFTGGPVARNAIIGLVRLRTREHAAGLSTAGDLGTTGADGDLDPPEGGFPKGWRGLFGEHSMIGTVDVATDPAPMSASFMGARLFSGYAGWETGQLESEIDDGSWFVVPPDERDPLTTDPENLWQRVLHRQGGALSVLSRIPDDPSCN